MLFTTQNMTIQSSKPGIATNKAAEKAFPDRGGGGDLGRTLHTDLFEIVHMSAYGRPAKTPASRKTVCLFFATAAQPHHP